MDVLKRFKEVRKYTETLCNPLKVEDYIPQAQAFVSPPKWHLAHTTWFYEEMILKPNLKSYQVFDEDYNFLFNSYYNSLGKRISREHRGLITRPSVDTVYQYRSYVNKHMEILLNSSQTDKQILKLVILGINHEQQHQELLITDIKFTLSHNPTNPKLYDTSYNNSNSETKPLKFLEVKEGVYDIGYTGKDFCYDNELDVHRVFLESYAIANRLITNGEYLEFIEANGYSTSKYWLDDGWTYINAQQIKKPLYWAKDQNQWYVYTLAGREPLNLDAPVTHISFYEAHAFANFKNKRLATEFEWEVANAQFNWGAAWEWTNSAYIPYPNYKKATGAAGEYNGKFMINLMVLRGSSVATSPNHSRPTYRNFFSPEARWQFSGIRLAK